MTGALAAALGTDEIACAFDVQVSTVQAHLKQVLAQAGSRHRTQLVALMWRSAFEWFPAPCPCAPR